MLQKLGISSLNTMQQEAEKVILKNPNTLVLSNTGSGKTLAFLLPIISMLDKQTKGVQAIVVAPTRELAIQIETVAKELGSGFRVLSVYGGQSFAKDVERLRTEPALLIATPGRLADHIERGSINVDDTKVLVLDEFDKSLEIGFENEMKTILFNLPSLRKKVLTSATQGVKIPNFVQAEPLSRVNHLTQQTPKIKFYEVTCAEKDKLPTIVPLLQSLKGERGIVFLNFKDAIERVSEALAENNINHVKFYGGTDQKDREQSLIQFRNNSAPILLATDLAARGIDVPALDYIVHYHLPLKKNEFTHRNGRTARMHAKGAAYVLKGYGESLPDYLPEMQPFAIASKPVEKEEPAWVTLKISGGRKDKISKGDLVGFFIKQGGLTQDEIGHIELKQEVSFVAVPKEKAQQLIAKLNNLRVKKRKVRISKI